MKPIRIAIIGYGKIAHDQHVPSIQGNPRFDLVATSSRSGQGVAHSFTDWRELVRTVEGLQAVAITTPPEPRFEIARECVAAGLHCLLEKPPTAGLAEIAALDCLAQGKDVTLFTTWHAQHHSTVDAAAKALAGKRIKSTGNPLARRRLQVASRTAVDLAARRVRRVRSGHQCACRSRPKSSPETCS